MVKFVLCRKNPAGRGASSKLCHLPDTIRLAYQATRSLGCSISSHSNRLRVGRGAQCGDGRASSWWTTTSWHMAAQSRASCRPRGGGAALRPEPGGGGPCAAAAQDPRALLGVLGGGSWLGLGFHPRGRRALPAAHFPPGHGPRGPPRGAVRLPSGPRHRRRGGAARR